MVTINAQDYARLVEEYQNLVFHICFQFLHNYFDAEDLAQETFVRAYEKLGSFDGENFKAWIATIAVNQCKNHLKSGRRKLALVSDELTEIIPSTTGLPEERTFASETDARVFRLCNCLKEPYRTVAVQYFCEDIPLSVVANDTGQPLKTLQTRLYRAKKQLAKLWEEDKVTC